MTSIEDKQAQTKRHKCTICGKCFVQNVSLTRHRKLHSENPRPHKCPGCEKSFAQHADLKKHLVLHSSDPKPHVCSKCGERFAQNSQLERHRHAAHIGGIYRKRNHACKECGKGFPHLCDLKRHLETHLLKRDKLFCEYCSRDYIHRGQLILHMKKKHPDKLPSKATVKKLDQEVIDKIINKDYLKDKPLVRPEPFARRQPKYRPLLKAPNKVDTVLNALVEETTSNEQFLDLDKLGDSSIQFQPVGESFHIDTKGSEEIMIVVIQDKDCETLDANTFNVVIPQEEVTVDVGQLEEVVNYDPMQDGECQEVQLLTYDQAEIEACEQVVLEEGDNVDIVPLPAVPEQPTLQTLITKNDAINVNNQDAVDVINEDDVDAINQDEQYTCPVCPRNLLSERGLKIHLMSHTRDINAIKCDICLMEFTKKQSLKRHLLLHSGGPKPYMCPICHKSFSQHGDVKRHLITHQTDPKPFKCGFCQKGFSQRWKLKSHIKTHMPGVVVDPKPHKCRVCLKGFASNCDRNRHEVIHSSVKPFECNVCGQRFNQKGHVTKHMLKHSLLNSGDMIAGKGQRLGNTRKNLQCEHCERYFHRKQNLLLHLTVHKQDHTEIKSEPKANATQADANAIL